MQSAGSLMKNDFALFSGRQSTSQDGIFAPLKGIKVLDLTRFVKQNQIWFFVTTVLIFVFSLLHVL